MIRQRESFNIIGFKNPPLVRLEQCFAEVVLGRPSAGCKHYGICKVERLHFAKGRWQSKSSCGCINRTKALLRYKHNNYLKISFWKTSLKQEILDKYFAEGCFMVDEEYTIPSEVLGTDIQIPKGIYNFDESSGFLTIRFELTQKPKSRI